MSGSLKDELLRLGLAKPKPDEPKQRRRDGRPPRSGERPRQGAGDRQARRAPDSRAEPSRPDAGRGDGARARPQPQPHARDGQTGAAQTFNSGTGQSTRAQDREREARMARLRAQVDAHKLDDPQADIKQYYSTGKKIKRIYVTEAQAAALLRGEIVIVIAQGKGRLVASTLLPALREIDPELRVVDPAAAAEPEDGVPDDLRW